MTNWEKLINGEARCKLPWRLVSYFDVPKNLFDWLKDNASLAKQSNNKWNTNLVGHIKEEYIINPVSTEFEKWLLDCSNIGPVQKVTDDLNILSENRNLFLESLWVNYGKKYEFNPPHKHSGVLSFVIFLNIPYDLINEEKLYPSVYNNYNCTSKFAFLNVNQSGNVFADPIDVDKSFEGKMLMFDAQQLHEVYPFYTSDDYRVTCSGNLKFKV